MTGNDTSMDLPELPLAAWADTKTTLHLFLQVAGKVRLALHPRLNHWWHVPLYVSARGLTTGAIPHPNGRLEIELDLVGHKGRIATSQGEVRELPLPGLSVAAFHRRLMDELAALRYPVRILARPFDPDRVGSSTPFAEDDEHATYDPAAVAKCFRILTAIDPVFQEFRGRFLGKCSPVHVFWHSFDLACTRFSGRAVPVSPDADPVTREAYSHEVISAGFWPGDADTAEPAFYCYAHPEPEGLADAKLAPDGAFWRREGSSMALLPYEAYRAAPDRRQALLAFLESSYRAAAERMKWPEGLTAGR